MGSQCRGCCSNYHSQNEMNLTPLGQDEEGVTEDYQHHETKVRKLKLKLSDFDLSYRRVAHPLHYMRIDSFFE